MARPKKELQGARAGRAASELARKFGAVQNAALAFNAGEGSLESLEIALDAVGRYEEFEEWPTLEDDAGPEERLLTLTKQLVNTSQIAARLRSILALVEGRSDQIKAEMISSSLMPGRVPQYAETLFRRLQEQGGGQPDFHPGSKGLASAMLAAARAHKKSAPPSVPSEEDYSHHPVSKWSELRRELNGFEFVRIEPGDERDPDPCPLPPLTDIASYTADHKAPPTADTFRKTLSQWAVIIEAWASRVGRPLSKYHASTWAFLLAHRLKNDDPSWTGLAARELRSPWDKGRLVRIEALDDVPF